MEGGFSRRSCQQRQAAPPPGGQGMPGALGKVVSERVEERRLRPTATTCHPLFTPGLGAPMVAARWVALAHAAGKPRNHAAGPRPPPSAIGACWRESLGGADSPVASRTLPEIAMRPACSLSAPCLSHDAPSQGDALVDAASDACTRWPGSHSQRRRRTGNCSNQRTAFARHPQPSSLERVLRSPAATSRLPSTPERGSAPSPRIAPSCLESPIPAHTPRKSTPMPPPPESRVEPVAETAAAC